MNCCSVCRSFTGCRGRCRCHWYEEPLYGGLNDVIRHANVEPVASGFKPQYNGSYPQMKNLDLFFSTACERHKIYLRRAAGHPAPWTDDPVFQRWRFCNVFRELDKTTVWFRENVRSKIQDPVQLAAATIVFRWFNRIETGELVKDLLGTWNSNVARERFKTADHPICTGAFVINTRAIVGLSKSDGVLWCIDKTLPHLKDIVPGWGASLQAAWKDLQRFPSMGKFMAYEVVTDLRWTPVLENAQDILTWASAGTGCARGLGWLVYDDPTHFDFNSKRDQSAMIYLMRQVLKESRKPEHWPEVWPTWELREVEHWLCEWDKWRRATNGERLKRSFHV